MHYMIEGWSSVLVEHKLGDLRAQRNRNCLRHVSVLVGYGGAIC